MTLRKVWAARRPHGSASGGHIRDPRGLTVRVELQRDHAQLARHAIDDDLDVLAGVGKRPIRGLERDGECVEQLVSIGHGPSVADQRSTKKTTAITRMPPNTIQLTTRSQRSGSCTTHSTGSSSAEANEW